MDLLSQLGLGLSLSAGKFLFKQFVGPTDAVGEVGGDALADLVKDRVKDAVDQRTAGRRFEDLGFDLARRLVADLTARHRDVSAERWGPVVRRLEAALAGNVTADFVVHNRADPARLFEALKAVPVRGTPPLSPDDEPLLDDGLRSAARYLAAATNKLPRFDAAQVRQTLDLLDTLRSDIGQVLDDVRAIRERGEQGGGPTREEYETDYRQAVSQSLDWVELFGVDLPDELRRVRLTDAYVTLNLEDRSDDEPEADGDGRRPVSTEAAFADLLPQTGRLLVRGPAGGGKTTLVKWAAVQAARMAPPARPDQYEFEAGPDGVRIRHDHERDRLRDEAARDWRRRVPFVVYLRRCQGGELPAPHEFPAAIAKEIGSPPPAWVEQVLRAGRGLVLIDGIDEVPQLNRPRLQAAVGRLVATYPKSFFVLTTRPEAVGPGWLGADGFQDVWVDTLSPGARDALIRRWFEAAARGRRPAADPGGSRRDADELITTLGRSGWLTALVTNPLLCAMTCALFAARRGFLPDGLRQMCEVLTELMLHRLDQERGVDLSQFGHPYPQLKYAEKKAVVRQVAYHMVLNEQSTLPVPKVHEQIARALGRMPDRSPDEAGAVFRGLLDRGGMWREATPAEGDRPAAIEFQHNTFKEFLAGEQAADDGNAHLVLARLDQAGWQRVGLFAVAAGTGSFQNEFLRGLLGKIPDPLPKVTRKQPADEGVRQLAFYALQCRGQALRCDEPIKARLNALAGQLVPPRNMSDAACLAAGGNSAVSMLGYDDRYANVQAACVRALKLIGTPEAMAVLRDYWRDETRNSVGIELVGTADPFDVLGEDLVRQFEGNYPPQWWVMRSIRSLEPLAGNSKVHSLDLRGLRGVDLSLLASFGSLRRLDLQYIHVADYNRLPELTGLQELSLVGVGVADLAPIAGCRGLRSLDLAATLAQDLRPLAALDRLETLDVSYTGVVDAAPLAGLTRLRTLNLAGTPLTDTRPLAGLIHLGHLDLSDTEITNVAPLAGLSNLRTLTLVGTPVTDLSPLAGLTGLKVIGP